MGCIALQPVAATSSWRGGPLQENLSNQADLNPPKTLGMAHFVHSEAYTTNLADKAWEGQLCGQSKAYQAYRVYN